MSGLVTKSNKDDSNLLPNNVADIKSSKQKEKKYLLANIYKVMFARIFDLLLSSIPGIIMSALILNNEKNIGNWTIVSIVLSITFFWMLIYFVLIPFILNGQTIGKLIFNIRLIKKNSNTIGIWPLFLREFIFTIFPWIILVFAQITATLIMSQYQYEEGMEIPANLPKAMLISSLILNISYFFYAIWILMIGLTIKIQKEQQSSIDMKFDLYVVNKLRKEVIYNKVENKQLKRNDEHISLKDQPGNFDDEVIDYLYISEEQEAKSSIYLEKQNMLENLLIEKENKKLIESNKNKGDKNSNE